MTFRPVLMLLGTFSTLTVESAAQSIGTQVAMLLPQGAASVQVFEFWAPPRLTALTQQLQLAAQSDPEWFQQQVRRAGPGQPLPYDPKLGLTESEYGEFLLLTDSTTLRPTRTEVIVLESTRTGWRFGSGTTLAGLQGVAIDTIENEVLTTFGRLTSAPPIIPSSGQRATGAWGGPQWKFESLDEATMTGVVASFALGKHQPSGQTVIYFDARRAERGQQKEREYLFLRVGH